MTPIRQQEGAALFVGLMFLLLLTILGLSSSNVAIMQERMAGNVSDSNVAFQQAERTLREVEERLTRYVSGGAGGLGFVPPTWEQTGLERNNCTMSGINWGSPSGDLAWQDAPSTDGQFMVVDLSDYMSDGTPFGSSCRPVSEADMNTAGEYFLIVARADSPTGTTESIIQSIFFWPQ
jgi:type IV pilus assembly protein PilX